MSSTVSGEVYFYFEASLGGIPPRRPVKKNLDRQKVLSEKVCNFFRIMLY